MQIYPMKKEQAEAVLALWNEACIEAIGYPLSDASANRILNNLRQYAEHDTHQCLVVDNNQQLVGFITFGVMGHPIQNGLVGEIEELYAQPDYMEAKKSLVKEAVIWLKQQGVGVVTTRVAVDDPDDLAFWYSLKWEQDTVNFNIYSDVPADANSQGVWDSYQ
ncbi:MAG: GNAT family N-acetyltransferase [Chloroflexota bacterium]